MAQTRATSAADVRHNLRQCQKVLEGDSVWQNHRDRYWSECHLVPGCADWCN